MVTLGSLYAVLKIVAALLSVLLSGWKLYRFWKRKRKQRKPTA